MPTPSTSARLLVAAALCFGPGGCSDKAPTKSKGKNTSIALDTALAKISPIAAMYKVDIVTNRTVSCLISDALAQKAEGSGPKQNELGEKLIAQMMAENSSRCEFFTKAVAATDVAFEKIKADGKLPDEAYLFSIFGSRDENNKYEKTDIGLFLSLASCEHTEQLARQIGVGTQPCRRWRWPETGVP